MINIDTTDKIVVQLRKMLLKNEVEAILVRQVEAIIKGVEKGEINISDYKRFDTDIKLKEVISVAISRIV